MKRLFLTAALLALGLFALSGPLAGPSARAQVPPQQPPDECGGAYDLVVYMTSPILNSYFGGSMLVFAPATGNATVNLYRAHDSCIVAGSGRLIARVYFGDNVLYGGPQSDVLYGGLGRDLIIGNGIGGVIFAPFVPAAKDVENGGPGIDTCIGLPAETVKISCEIQLDEQPEEE